MSYKLGSSFLPFVLPSFLPTLPFLFLLAQGRMPGVTAQTCDTSTRAEAEDCELEVSLGYIASLCPTENKPRPGEPARGLKPRPRRASTGVKSPCCSCGRLSMISSSPARSS